MRSSEEPYGKSVMSEKMIAKVEAGNNMALWFFSLLELALHAGLAVWFENPAGSYVFKLPKWQEILSRWPTLKAWLVDYCRYGTTWRKRAKFLTNIGLGGLRTLCNGCQRHQLLQGRSK